MEKFTGYIIMKQYSSGSKSDGNVAYLYISPNKIYKLYRAEVLPLLDTYFDEYHLKSVMVSGVFHQRIRSIKVDSIELIEDPFSIQSGNEEQLPND
jgi:hypothetical protein